MRFVVIGLVLVSLALAWSWPRRPDHRPDQPLAQSLLVGAWLGLLLLAALPRAFTVKRQLLVLLPYLALLTGYVLAQFPRPTGELVAGLGLSVTLLALPSHQREPWRAVVTDLVQTELDQSTVIWVDDLSVTVFDYYLRHGQVEADQVQWTPLFGRDMPQLPNLAPQPGDTLWVVTSENVYRHLAALLPKDFYRRYQLQEERHTAGIGLYRYQRRVEPLPGQPELSAPDHHLDAWGLLLPSPLDTCRPR